MTDTLRELKELTTATEAARETQRLLHRQFGLSPESDQDLASAMLRELQIDFPEDIIPDDNVVANAEELMHELRKRELQEWFEGWWAQYTAERPTETHKYEDLKGAWNVRNAPFESVAQRIFELYLELRLGRFSRDAVTELALEASLCPIHFVDYAICFDDQDPECDQIRVIHPSHDT